MIKAIAVTPRIKRPARPMLGVKNFLMSEE
jgi:hypothetical protein